MNASIDNQIRLGAISAIAVAIFVIALPPAWADSYEVAFSTARTDDDGALRRADVTAVVTPDRGLIRLNRNGPDTGIFNQWATFVLDIQASDSVGEALELETVKIGAWRLKNWRRGPVTVKYAMILQHDRFPNEPGDDELAVAKPYGVMWTGRALFIEGAPAENISVSFTAPDGWRATTPWSMRDASGLSFEAADTDDLLESAFFAGAHETIEVAAGGAAARIATGPDMAAETALFRKTLHTFLPAYADLFGSENTSTPVIVALPGSFWGGGVIGRTISLTHGGALSPEIEPMVSYIVAHEAYHLWNAQWNYDARSRPALEWLVEGSAEYYTWLTSVRTGAVPSDALLDQIAERWTTYKNAIGDLTIAEAGRTKLEDQNSYDMVYSGGMMLSLALDLTIRRETQNGKSLDDVIRLLQSRFTGTEGNRLTPSSFAQAIKSATGVRSRSFIEQYTRNNTVFPAPALLTFVGVCLEDSKDAAQNAAHAYWCESIDDNTLAARDAWLDGSGPERH